MPTYSSAQSVPVRERPTQGPPPGVAIWIGTRWSSKDRRMGDYGSFPASGLNDRAWVGTFAG